MKWLLPFALLGVLWASNVFAQSKCYNATVGNDVTIDNTAGGVTAAAANTNRCSLIIINVGSENIRCAPSTTTVTATAGLLLKPDQGFGITESDGGVKLAWKCIETGGGNSTVSVYQGTK